MLQNKKKLLAALLVGISLTAVAWFASFAYSIFAGRTISADLAVKVDLNNLNNQLNFYRQQQGAFPTTKQGLSALVIRPNSANDRWLQLLDAIPRDPWKHEYQYRYPGLKNPKGLDLFSYGPDGVESGDDIYFPADEATRGRVQ